MLITFFKSLYLTRRFFVSGLVLAMVFIVGYFHPLFLSVGKAALILAGVLIFVDLMLLYRSRENPLKADRYLPERFSNGDKNKVILNLENRYPFRVRLSLIDELPFQFQKRDFMIKRSLNPESKKAILYWLRPTERGAYDFGKLNVYAASQIALVKRRFKFADNQSVAVYPSFLKMRQYELMAISDRLIQQGSKQIRRISNNKEFEQIKEYVQGDDYRTVNWKATARMGKLMVNQYRDEKAQHIYNIIDLGRSMKMPFNGMSLSDYAINAALALADVSLIKDDKAGLITFSDKIHRVIQADRKSAQMQMITEALYKEQTNFLESDFEKMYFQLQAVSKQRSLLILYTNFESPNALSRQMKVLKTLARRHVVLLVFFKNTELETVLGQSAENLQEVYFKTIAEKMMYEKRKMVSDLKQNGIYSVLTEPENLTVETINAYLNLKTDGVI